MAGFYASHFSLQPRLSPPRLGFYLSNFERNFSPPQFFGRGGGMGEWSGGLGVRDGPILDSSPN